jgi:murein DD-endopeptidase MepM/ murein hydrolase activator NlpD
MNLQIKLLVTILFISLNSFSQKSRDTAMKIYKYPVKEGVIYKFENPPAGRLINIGSGVDIYSKESEVFAFMQGKISRVFSIDDYDYVLIRNKDTSVVYGNMDTVLKKAGDTVYKGELIGKLKKDADQDEYELSFDIMKGVKGLISAYNIELLKKDYK